ncbi:MAG: flavodoxin [Lachnospiraceae bacterium]|nr:flavodoxin [Lachnospiraceae bacterium]
MKKITAILLTILMVISLAACAGGNDSAKEKTSENKAETDSVENVSAENTSSEAVSDITTESEPTNDTSENEPTDKAEETKILVVYFSATNTTEGVAELIADGLSADIYEIIPEQPYTDADLNYHDDNSRSTIEMNDPNSRPAISGSVENMEQYDIVFIGYPIWWGDAPRILSTFMESYDFSGKTIVPFCTSGGSGVGSSATNLEALTNGATWLSGTRLSGGSSHEEIVDWVNGLGLDIKAE